MQKQNPGSNEFLKLIISFLFSRQALTQIIVVGRGVLGLVTSANLHKTGFIVTLREADQLMGLEEGLKLSGLVLYYTLDKNSKNDV
jgi:ribulose 1,5-bisphosphate synthetase/thiazole synthase